MIRRIAPLAAALALLLAPAAARADGAGGTFSVDCDFSHRAQVDPIVNPGPSPSTHSGHMHDFYGNRSTDSDSTFETLTGTPLGTTCKRNESSDDARESYWHPTLIVADQDVTATSFIPGASGGLSANYTAGVRDAAAIRPLPADLRVIAGKAAGGPAEINGQRVFMFYCGEGGTAVKGTATVAPTCVKPRLQLTVGFPDCWDGQHLDSPNHQDHMSYSKQATPGFPFRVCDSAHPALVPKLTLLLRFPTTGGPSTRLSSGAINTMHVDFLNSWRAERMAQLTRDCINPDEYCGGSNTPVPGH